MERISAGDAAFVYMENRVVRMHVIGVLILDPSTMRDGYSFERFRSFLQQRLHRIELFRRRLLRDPLGIDHPVWVDEPDFDLDSHMHRIDLGGSATTADLAAWVGDFASVPLDYDRPLWDMNIVEGLADGTIAVVTKMHHVAVDGTTGTGIMAELFDLTPDAPVTAADENVPEHTPHPVPNPAMLLLDAVRSRITDPWRGVRAMGRTLSSVGRLLQNVAGGGDDTATMARPFDAPRTFFNRSLTRRRSIAFGSAPLDDLRTARTAFDVTVNDVFLAACTQALRAYLADHGETFDRPLVTSLPVSMHGKVAEAHTTNQVSNMFVRLPVHLDDPVEQLRSIHLDTVGAKAAHDILSADIMGDVTELTPPGFFNMASRMYSRAGLAERLAPIHNLVISNVPGPPVPLYVAGAELRGVYPFGPLIEGSGLNITGLSNMGNLDIGIIACPDVAPDIDQLLDGILAGIATLRTAAGRTTGRAGRAGSARPRKPSSRPSSKAAGPAKATGATKATGSTKAKRNTTGAAGPSKKTGKAAAAPKR